MVTSIYDVSSNRRPQLSAYTYDQLNRIDGMKTLSSLTLATNLWAGSLGSSLTPYESTYKYDANGNIDTIYRQGSTGNLDMDRLIYEYDWVDPLDHSLGKKSNQLLSVTDNLGIRKQDNDFEYAVSYYYDSIGNLTQEIDDTVTTTIVWNNYGKVDSVKRSFGYKENPSADLIFAYDAMGNRIMKRVIPRTTAGALNTSMETYTYYVRDAQGNIMATYEIKAGEYASTDLYLGERYLYGSSRLGSDRVDNKIAYIVNQCNFSSPVNAIKMLGKKFYEVSNHLGNVLATVSDRKIQVDDGYGSVDYYRPDIQSTQDYYPFGSLMPGRQSTPGEYRFGFNGQEKDDEWKGSGNSLEFKFRLYDPRIGRFFSVDLLANRFPWWSPYQFAGNTPIELKELEGMETVHATRYYDQANNHVSTVLRVVSGTNSDGNSYPVNSNITDKNGVNHSGDQAVIIHRVIGEELDKFTVSFGSLNTTERNAYNSSEAWRLEKHSRSGKNSAGELHKAHDRYSKNVPMLPITRNTSIALDIDFVPSMNQFVSYDDVNTVVKASAQIINQTSSFDDGNGSSVTVTTSSVVTINLRTNLNNTGPGTFGGNLLESRFNRIRDILVGQGVPTKNISKGTIQGGQTSSSMGNHPNETILNIRTTTTTSVSETARATEDEK